MILTRLQLQHFRNYRRLDLEFGPGSTLVYGANGAGKTNIVEAIFSLATTKSFRARTDRELIDLGFDPLDAPYPFARLQGEAESATKSVKVEMLLTAHEEGVRKQFRLNGLPKRASDVVGQIKAVLFSPTDVEIVGGSPSGRRRYIDVMLSQVDPTYLRILQAYSKTVQQRNAVLTRLGGRSDRDLLEIWDDRLINEGTKIVMRRRQMMERLSGLAQEAYRVLSREAEQLSIGYLSTTGEWKHETPDGAPTSDQVAAAFAANLEAQSNSGRDLRVTPVGPHRDDLIVDIDGNALLAFGSRGQQRTAALALRMAEAQYIAECTGQEPVLLLDEALGELDDDRRDALVAFSSTYPQVVLTGTNSAAYPEAFRHNSMVLEVHDGTVKIDHAHSSADKP